MDRSTGRHNMTEILLKMALNTMQSINQSFSLRFVNSNVQNPTSDWLNHMV